MNNDMQYYLYIYDSTQRIYSRNKSEYQTGFTAIEKQQCFHLVVEKYNVACSLVIMYVACSFSNEAIKSRVALTTGFILLNVSSKACLNISLKH